MQTMLPCGKSDKLYRRPVKMTSFTYENCLHSRAIRKIHLLNYKNFAFCLERLKSFCGLAVEEKMYGCWMSMVGVSSVSQLIAEQFGLCSPRTSIIPTDRITCLKKLIFNISAEMSLFFGRRRRQWE